MENMINSNEIISDITCQGYNSNFNEQLNQYTQYAYAMEYDYEQNADYMAAMINR